MLLPYVNSENIKKSEYFSEAVCLKVKFLFKSG